MACPADPRATCGRGLAPGPCTRNPSFGWSEVLPFGTCWAVVNHRTFDDSAPSPVEVLVTRVEAPEPRSPRSATPTLVGVEPVLVTTLIQRRNSPLSGTKTLRVRARL